MAYVINITGLRAKLFLLKSGVYPVSSLKCEGAECHFLPYNNLRNELQLVIHYVL